MDKEFLPFPRSRRVASEALRFAVRRHIVHGLLEADITEPRRMLKDTRGSDGHPLSLTAYIIACYARAIHAHPAVHVYRTLDNRLLVFNDVDVSTFVDHPDGQGVPVPHVVRRAHERSVREISDELRAVKAGSHPLGWLEKVMPLASHVPGFMRTLTFSLMKWFPGLMKRIDGTAQLSAFGMFGKGLRWGVGQLYIHTVGAWIGSMVPKPMAYNGGVALRDCLHLTVSINHDIVDGAPGGRFVGTFIELLESGSLLEGEIPPTA
ncbi:MAG: hypothetical protein C3F13_02575 [Anaerolineales bacterium]|nr:MAG: hypothetical protein C3F13_02575 [Anaerolineales bacterium]